MKRSKMRLGLVALPVVMAVLGGGIAYAYWSTHGAGTGTAGVGVDAAVTVTQDSTVTALSPGSAAQPLDFTINNTGPAATQVNVKSVVISFGSFGSGCSAADFTLTQPLKPSPSGQVAILPNTSASFTSAGTGANSGTTAAIAMNNTAANQDGCKGTTVALVYTVS